ncbi:glycosyltransferase [Lacinutrix salivirga]
MKILMVSMPSLHFFRWTEQLEDSGHEVFWFDILDSGGSSRLHWVTQFTNWKLKYPKLKGRHFVKKHVPKLYKSIRTITENNAADAFEKVLLEVQPDCVHSFVLQISGLPILEVMKTHKHIPWIYSSWGSDLFNKANKPNYEADLNSVLNNTNFLFTDNLRDYNIAKHYGFKGKFLGAFPGGGGFKVENTDWITPIAERNTILIKGYQGALGRSIEVLKAIASIENVIKKYKIVVFGSDDEVVNFINQTEVFSTLNIEIHNKQNFLAHDAILQLMGKSLIYIGNSVSDGMPNTLLEAITMGAFPIQSNPGGVTKEVITHQKNGLLIENCEAVHEISQQIKTALTNPELIKSAFTINQNNIKPKFEYQLIKNKVLQAYNSIAQ